MILLVFAFLVIGLLTFCIVAFATKATPEQKALDRRIVAIKASNEDAGAKREDLEQYLRTETAGSFAWLEDLVESSSFSYRVRQLIVQANSTTSLGSLMVKSLVLAIGSTFIVYAVTSMVLVALPVGLGMASVPFVLLRMRKNRRVATFNKALPDAIDMMSRSLRAGHSMAAAIGIVAEQAVAPVSLEFGEVFKKQNFGLPMRDAMLQMLDRVPSQDLRVLVTGIMVQKDTGGNLVDILDRIVFVIRERLRIQGEIKTHTAQGRMTGWILCALPPIMMVLINMINPGYSKVLTSDPFGRTILYIGIGLLALGAFVIRQIINGIEV